MVDLNERIARCEREEQLLQFDHFNHEDAWTLGTMLVNEAKARGLRPAFQITLGNYMVFRYGFDGTNYHNDMWMRRKTNTVNTTHMSTFHVNGLLARSGEDVEKDWFLPAMDYAVMGGGFPLIIRGTGVVGCICCSGLPHEIDHQLVVDTIAKYLNIPPVE